MTELMTDAFFSKHQILSLSATLLVGFLNYRQIKKIEDKNRKIQNFNTYYNATIVEGCSLIDDAIFNYERCLSTGNIKNIKIEIKKTTRDFIQNIDHKLVQKMDAYVKRMPDTIRKWFFFEFENQNKRTLSHIQIECYLTFENVSEIINDIEKIPEIDSVPNKERIVGLVTVNLKNKMRELSDISQNFVSSAEEILK